MKFNIEVNAKCKHCIHFVFETEDGTEFLDDSETFCDLTKKKIKPSHECKDLTLDIQYIKGELKDMKFTRSKISKV